MFLQFFFTVYWNTHIAKFTLFFMKYVHVFRTPCDLKLWEITTANRMRINLAHVRIPIFWLTVITKYRSTCILRENVYVSIIRHSQSPLCIFLILNLTISYSFLYLQVLIINTLWKCLHERPSSAFFIENSHGVFDEFKQ